MNGTGTEDTYYSILLILSITFMQLRLYPGLSVLGLSTSRQKDSSLGSGKYECLPVMQVHDDNICLG